MRWFAARRSGAGLRSTTPIFYREWDNRRIEGPAFVWYFRGFPHVHIWCHVADDPTVPVTSHFE